MRYSICLCLLLATILIAAFKTKEGPDPTPTHDLILELDRFNSMISGLDSLRFNEIGQGRMTVSAIYSRKKGIILTYSTSGREEMTVVADGSVFWFWCRSFDPSSVYFCRRDDIGNTRVRPELYPCVALGLLCARPIPREDVTMMTGSSGPRLATQEEGLVREIVLKEGRITSQVFYSGDKPLVSMEFKEFQEEEGFTLPKKVFVTWHEQGMRAELSFGKAEVNKSDTMDSSMPRGFTRVNLDGF